MKNNLFLLCLMPLAVQLTRSFVLRFSKHSLVFAQSNICKATRRRALFVLWTLSMVEMGRETAKKYTHWREKNMHREKRVPSWNNTLPQKHFHISVHTRYWLRSLKLKFYAVIIEARHSFYSSVNNVKRKLQSLFSTIEIGACTRKHTLAMAAAAVTAMAYETMVKCIQKSAMFVVMDMKFSNM